MKLDREKFIDETCGSLDEAMNIIDGLLSTLDHYISNDESSGGNGYGCFCNPQKEVEDYMKNIGVELDYIEK